MINTRDSRELEALKIIWQKGGKASMRSLARPMGINSDYARLVLLDIGKKDYIDIKRDGICLITKKGKQILKNRGILDQIAGERKEKETPPNKIITLNY